MLHHVSNVEETDARSNVLVRITCTKGEGISLRVTTYEKEERVTESFNCFRGLALRQRKAPDAPNEMA